MKQPRITNGAGWGPGEAVSVNEFLNTPLGTKWIRYIYSLKPKVDQTSTERAALSGVFAAGYEKVFEEISNSRTALKLPESASVEGIDPTKD